MSDELLAAHDMQGNILAGFNKDWQAFLFLRMERDATSMAAVKAWLRAIAPQVSTLAEVHRFNELFHELRVRLGRDPHGFCATWMNIAFSAKAIEALTSANDVEQFTDLFFRDGLAASSAQLGDPEDPAHEGHPDRWVVGGPQSEADILVIIASDSPVALGERVEQLKATLTQAADPQSGLAIGTALQVLWEERGETLPPPLVGHEHFGFKDGVSQPGVRGVMRTEPLEYLTQRLLDGEQNDPAIPEWSRPGQPLVHAGQFVFGYKRQSKNDPRTDDGVEMNCPEWGRNGSYVVVRRLKQDVAAFRDDMRKEAKRLAVTQPFAGVTPTRLASLLVGRWPSGAPIVRTPLADDPNLGADRYASNYFQFADKLPEPPKLIPAANYAGDKFPLSPRDLKGVVCPLASHIRKINPRDGNTEQGNNVDVLARMVLRRGVPFGPAYPGHLDEEGEVLDQAQLEVQRGLMFVSYQTSIENQFVFLQRNWANHDSNPNKGGGEDPIIGAGNADQERKRFVTLRAADGTEETLELREWVTPTGGGFFFSPAISAITDVLAIQP